MADYAGTVIVGAGVSGLATAYFLRRSLGPDYPITVLDTASYVGGKVRTTAVAGLPVDTGPDAYLSRSPELRELVAELGLADQVVAPLPGGAYVWSRGALRPLPPGLAFGLPERLVPVLRSGLLSPLGALRAGFDLVLPTTRTGEDPSVAELVRPRFGDQVYERLVSPLLGGVHAGDPAALSARSAVPEIAATALSNRSVYLALRRRRRATPSPSSPAQAPLVSLEGGLSGLVGALRGALGRTAVHTGVRGQRVDRRPAGGYTVVTEHGGYDAEQVVLATPAYVTADLLADLAPPAADLLRAVPYVDVANVTLAFRREEMADLPRGTGFLVPPVEGELIVGCSWLTQKWPHLAGTDTVLVKSMVGRAGDRRWMTMSDDELVVEVRAGLGRLLGIAASPVDVRVQRWPGAMPQYVVGHSARLDALDQVLRDHPGLQLTGAAYRGVGLAGCVAQAQATATRIATDVAAEGVPA